MKKHSIIISMVMIIFVSLSWAKDLPSPQVITYYFYTNVRCPSCYKIEQYTKEAIEKYFTEDLASGRLVFKPLNTDQKENQHFIKDYQLYTKSVVISMMNGGKEVKYENLTKVWQCLRDKQKFYDYIKTETNKYLDEVK